MVTVTPDHRPGAQTPAEHRSPGDEAQLQQDLAEGRAAERGAERLATEEILKEPDGLLQANDPVRVAKRLDRVTRYMGGGDPLESPADASVEVLVQNAMERAAEVLPTTPTRSTAAPDGYRGRVIRRDGGSEAPAGAELGSESGPAAQTVLLERIINTSDFLSVRYLDAGVLAQHPVGRVNIRDGRGKLRGYGTGFMVSPTLLLTNHHVLPDEETAGTSIIEFHYQDGVDGKPLPQEVHPFDPDRFFVADRELDFALVAVDAPPDVLAGYGYCHLTAAQGTVIIGESVTIVQHPRGEKKQIALRENRIIDIPELVVHYAADTEPGSSGSPVFNDQWEVVALHHASVPTPDRAPEYTFLNEGIRISRILKFLAEAQLTPERRALVDGLATIGRATTARPTGNGAASPASASATASSATTGVTALSTASARPPAPLETRAEDDGAAHGAPVADGGVARAAPAADGSVTLEVPLRITIQLGSPTLGGVTTLPTAAPVATAVPVAALSTTGDGALPEAISIDPDYSTRSGYDPEFLGVPLPLPGVDGSSPELRYHHFSVVMDRRRRLARLTAVNIDGAKAAGAKRETDRWIIDPRLSREDQTGEDVYADNDLDRGHLVRRLDPAWGPDAKAANDDTFHFTNCVPQHHAFNAGSTLWLGLEDYVLRNAETQNLAVSVLSGPVFDDADPVYRGVALPRQFWKLVGMVTTTGRLSVTAYLLSQEALLDEFDTEPEDFSFGAYRTFQVPVRRVAGLTGLDLAAFVAGDPLERLETTSLPREIVSPDDMILT